MAEVTYEDINNLGENYYDVSIFLDGQEEPEEHFCCFGSVQDIIDCMDSTCEELGYFFFHSCSKYCVILIIRVP